MSHSSPSPTPPSPRWRRFAYIGLAMGVVSLAGATAVTWWVRSQLAPIVSEAIGKILQRPIEIGDVDRFSLTGLRFSASTLPSTEMDPDEAEISAIEVEFNLLEVATNRVLPLHVTLVNPEARIEQDAEGNWIATELNIVKSDLLVQPQLRSIGVRGGQVVLIPNDGGQPIEINDADVAVELREENQRIVFDVAANPAGGRVRLEGEAFLPAEEPGEPGDRPLEVDARVLTQNIPLAQVGRAIPNLPLTVRSGELNTDLEVAFTADEPLPWQEEQLLPLLREGLEVRGKASLRQVAIAIPEVAELVKAEGNFRFQGERLWVERLRTSYGNVTARTDGRIDLREGYNLRTGIEVASWRSLLQTLKLDLPWEAEGAIALEARVRGALTSPLVSVRSRRLPNFLSPEPLATLLNVKGFQAELALSLQRLLLQVRRFEVLPGMGGVVSGKGTVDLQKQVALALDFGLEGVPLDPVILSVLDRDTFDALPVSTLGTLSATGRVWGKAEDPDVTANWQILEATYPGRGELRYRNEVLTLANTAFVVDGGALRLGGTVDLAREAIAATVVADGIQLQTLGAPVSALASARLDLSAPLNLTSLQQVRGNGDATVLLADGGAVRVPEISLNNGQAGATVLASNIAINPLIPPDLLPPEVRVPEDTVLRSLQFDVATSLEDPLNLNQARATGAATVAVSGGTADLETFTLANGNWSGTVAASSIALNPLVPADLVPSEINLPRNLALQTARFDLAGTVADLTDPNTVRASGSAQVAINGGTAGVQGFELANGNWQGVVEANQIAIAPLIAAGVVPEGVQIPNDAALTTAQLNVSGTLSPDPNTLQASGRATLRAASGNLDATDIALRDGRWQVSVRGDRLQLSQVVPDLRGALNSQLNASGTLADLSPAGIRFDGVFNFSQIPIGAAFLDRLEIPNFAPEKLSPYLDNSLTASVAWNGSALTLREVTSPAGFRVAGTVGVDFNRSLPITTLDLNVAQRNYDLATLPVALPNNITNDATPVQGNLDFEGRVTGTATDPRVAGALQLRELAVGGTVFDPVLTGTVTASLQEVDLDLRGNDRDRIALNAAKTPAGSPLPYAPRSLEVRRGAAIAVGSCQVEIFPCPNFALTVENFDLALLEPILPVRGTLNANLNANFRQLAVSGSTQVNQPWLQSPIGPVEAHAVQADFRYGDGVLQLSQARLLQGGTWWRDRPPSEYLLSGAVDIRNLNDPKFNGQLQIVRGDFQDLLALLRIDDLSDFGKLTPPREFANAEQVGELAVGTPRSPSVWNQLRRFAEIESVLARQRQQEREAMILPDLAELQGSITGAIAFQGSLNTGVEANFNLAGANWQWDEYKVQEFRATGGTTVSTRVEDGAVALKDWQVELQPLLVRLPEGALAFQGTLGEDDQSGTLTVREFPIALFRPFLPPQIPEFSGQLSLDASLDGRLENPQVVGTLRLEGGAIEQTAIKEGFGSFQYADAQLNFYSSVTVQGDNPIEIIATVPIAPDFVTAQPPSDEIDIKVTARNDALAVMNLVTAPQLSWQSGEGFVDLRVTGTLQEPLARGTVQLENVRLVSQALATQGVDEVALENLSGRITFDVDRLSVTGLPQNPELGLQGDFRTGAGSEGKAIVSGVLPLLIPLSLEDPDAAKPLTLRLDRLLVDLRGLYRGGVNGEIVVRGTMFNPLIGGSVEVRDGRLLLAGAAAGGAPVSGQTQQEPLVIPEFQGLQITLGRNFRIASPPVLNFVADGGFVLNGTLDDLRPDGTVRLRRGEVNIFTTRFDLQRGYAHRAVFRPEFGLDPVLDLRLATSVQQVTRPTDLQSGSAEIAEASITNLGEVDTVRVEAIVDGRASELLAEQSDALELRSSPPRTESEIVALLGGGFVDTLGGNELGAIANIAGSAILSRFDTSIGDALGLDEFRLFPTTTNNEGEFELGLGAEAGIDITRNVTFSILKILTSEDPAQFNLRYRLSDRVTIRGTTDFAGENRAVILYEVRF